MTSTPQHFDYSIPPSPVFPPVPRVSPASSVSSLHSLYELDGQRLQASFQYLETTFHEYDSRTESPHDRVINMSNESGAMFSEDDLAKAFKNSSPTTGSLHSSPTRGGLAHDASDPSSPWKRSIRVRYSDVNMRDTNATALREASDLLSRDMSSYVNSEDESSAQGSPISKSKSSSVSRKGRLQEALKSLEPSSKMDARKE